jgi:hypothetical protein
MSSFSKHQYQEKSKTLVALIRRKDIKKAQKGKI